jgi:hypothetical protein
MQKMCFAFRLFSPPFQDSAEVSLRDQHSIIPSGAQTPMAAGSTPSLREILDYAPQGRACSSERPKTNCERSKLNSLSNFTINIDTPAAIC